MIIRIKLDSEIPIYEQLRRQLIIGIAKGEFAPGEELQYLIADGKNRGISKEDFLKTISDIYWELEGEN